MNNDSVRPKPLFKKVSMGTPPVIDPSKYEINFKQCYVDAEKMAAELFPQDLIGDAVKKIMQEEERALTKQLLRVAEEDGITDFIVLDTIEIKKILRKQVPYKPTKHKLIIGVGRCKCGVEFLDADTNYCGNCGQLLDWSDLKDD